MSAYYHYNQYGELTAHPLITNPNSNDMLSESITNSPFHIDQRSLNLIGAVNQRNVSYPNNQNGQTVASSQALIHEMSDPSMMYMTGILNHEDGCISAADVYLRQMGSNHYEVHNQIAQDISAHDHRTMLRDENSFRSVENVQSDRINSDNKSNSRHGRVQTKCPHSLTRCQFDNVDAPRPCKSRRRTATVSISSNPTSSIDRVFVWDLDETAIVFQSLLSGEYASNHNKDVQTCLSLGLQMEDLIFYLCDNYLFFKDLEECDQMHIDDMSADDNGQDLRTYDFNSDGLSTMNAQLGFVVVPTAALRGNPEWTKKVALRFRRIKELVSCSQDALQSLLPTAQYERWLRLRCEIEQFTESWTTLALRALSQIFHRNDCVNLLVTSTHLVPAIAKMMLFGLNNVFRIENIYSATKLGKEKCFQKLSSNFHRNATFVVIGDGREEETAAKTVICVVDLTFHALGLVELALLEDIVSFGPRGTEPRIRE